ncbi:YckD family protein [Paenibacillus hexagrammi]|uniref:YckD family protein n=1 Tax=Paenibacillus hexagrammi TaxID=2908839 RepID=A0ABY3SLK7_9BACL|nr:YckD family protein [Paenibacillus sp. YPD9-1]UJF34000.1 YckD family protein [Paenibacillus sp. YPD9-1]
MKKVVKVVLASTLAVGLLAGGGFALQHNQAFADEAGTAAAASTPSTGAAKDHKSFGSRGKGGFHKEQFIGGFMGGKGMMDPASVLGIDASVFKEEIKQGKTIAQIAEEKANLTEDALLQKLTEAETKRIDDAVTAGKLTQEQADKMKAGLADRLKKMVESTPKSMGFQGKPQGRMGGMMPGPWGIQRRWPKFSASQRMSWMPSAKLASHWPKLQKAKA